ncbi:hypothetical protein [Thiomonas sp. X19]|uniref:hypothetical protein n=1 Tax=Thiomonas sp. X19 TaxID=1050370 RepID=UPI0018EC443B|nr:hypothetical protein [Thiomonas sp. X19]
MHAAPQASSGLEPSIMVKPHAVTARKALLTLAFIGACASWLMGVAQARAQEPQQNPAEPHAAIVHLCGGVGDASLQQLKARAKDFNLGFWMVGGPGGAYLADVPIQIQSHGKTVASFTASGPLCYVKLPAGTYTVMGTHHGQTRSIQVHAGSMNQSLRW